MAGAVAVVPVRTDVVNRKTNCPPQGYSYSAPTMLVLFAFINAVAGGAAIIQTRRFGVFARADPRRISRGAVRLRLPAPSAFAGHPLTQGPGIVYLAVI